jgi:protein TonB
LKIFIALTVSILIHVGAFFYLKNNEIIKPIEHKSHQDKNHKKTHIKYVNIKPPVKKQEIKKPKQIKPKPIKKKEPPKKEKTIPKPKKTIEPEKKIPKLVKELKKKKIVQTKKVQKETPQKVEKKKPEPINKVEELPKQFQELYKEDFKNLPKESQVFLIKHIKDIGKITEVYLEYPMISVQARQEGINVVQFTLYPNGKISTPVISKSSKYFLLDDNTIETIQAAYKDYPRPSKPTLIRIYVKYSLR